MRVTKDSIIGDVLREDIRCQAIFFAAGMHCAGCPSAAGETIEEACSIHMVDADELVAALNDFLGK